MHIGITFKSREWLLERKLTLIRKMNISNYSTLVFTIPTYIFDSLDKFVANTGSVPNFCPLGTGADEKYLQDSYGVSPRTQIKSDYSDKHI